jgi:hypothetical protein
MSIGNQSYDFIDFILSVSPFPPDSYPLYTSFRSEIWLRTSADIVPQGGTTSASSLRSVFLSHTYSCLSPRPSTSALGVNEKLQEKVSPPFEGLPFIHIFLGGNLGVDKLV